MFYWWREHKREQYSIPASNHIIPASNHIREYYILEYIINRKNKEKVLWVNEKQKRIS